MLLTPHSEGYIVRIAMAYRLAAILSTDVARSRVLLEEQPEEARAMLEHYRDLVGRLLSRHDGALVKRIGDGFVLSFSSAQNATQYALALLREAASYGNTAETVPLLVRIGIDVGEVHEFENDVVGEAVTTASELEAMARPGSACVSEGVYRFLRQADEIEVTRLGALRLGRRDESVTAYELRIPDSSGPSGERHEAREANRGFSEELDERELRNRVLVEIKRAGRRLSVEEMRQRFPDGPPALERVLANLAAKGFLTSGGAQRHNDEASPRGEWAPQRTPLYLPERRGFGDEKADKAAEKEWDEVLEHEFDSPEEEFRVVSEYARQTSEGFEKAQAGFRGHLASYVGVNGLLGFIWATTGGGFPWFLFPLLGWGIGISTHFAGLVEQRREVQQLQSARGLRPWHVRLLRKLAKARSAFSSHLVSNGATSALLLTINLLTSPGFMWSLIPIGAMAVGLAGHYPSFKSRERRVRKQLRESGVRVSRRSLSVERGRGGLEAGIQSRRFGGNGTAAAANDPGAEAEALSEDILDQLSRFEKGSAPFGKEIKPILQDYVGRIKELSEKDAEIARIVDSVPIRELERDLTELSEKREQSEDARFIAECDRSIEQILKQKRSFEELGNEQEILRLRLRSAVNALKQMQLDLARMQSITSSADLQSLSLVKEHSRSLSEYLEDLKRGYEELERD
jgi:class 3 adenylate cyclase